MANNFATLMAALKKSTPAPEAIAPPVAEAPAESIPAPIEEVRPEVEATSPELGTPSITSGGSVVPDSIAGKIVTTTDIALMDPAIVVDRSVESRNEFEIMLDLLDAKMTSDSGRIDPLTLGETRKIVTRIMTDLKANPSYDGLFMDRDAHNVMKFMWGVKELAIETTIKKTETKETKSKKVAKVSNFAASLGNLSLDDF